jgi:hypothetical protein
VILLDIVTGADTAIAENARAVIHQKDRRRSVELATAGEWPRGWWGI